MSNIRATKLVFFLLVAALGLPCVLLAARAELSLSGPWRLRLDPNDEGVRAGWMRDGVGSETMIELPNTTDRAGFGFALQTNSMTYGVPFPPTTRFPGVEEPARADEHGYLVRRHLFVGPAWYEREIEVPAGWQGRPVTLRLERAMWRTEVWLDGAPAGTNDSLVAEHRYALGALRPGKHRLTIRVDNRMIYNLSTVSHAYGPETQSQWNGLIGRLRLEAAAPSGVETVAVFPAADRRSLEAAVTLRNATGAAVEQVLRARLLPERGAKTLAEGTVRVTCPPGEVQSRLRLEWSEVAEAWDEFRPVRYRLEVSAGADGEESDATTVKFGFREITATNRVLEVNGRRVFLRGTLDCCVYPKTGHPPMTVGEWERTLRVVKEYGFNHVRFHTWCPPEAAFEAADRLGLYLEPEVAAWVDDWGVNTLTKPKGIGRDPEVVRFLEAELRRVLRDYGNHPSFVLLAIGNEFGGTQTDWERVNAMVEELKRRDGRRLYSGCTARRHLAADDFWITHNSGASTRGIGPAHTDWDFSKAAAASPVPLLAHETGQRPVFPDYPRLLPKFTGPLLPLNLERFRRGLAASGLEGQLTEFVAASARFQFIQYKAEHEGMLRTAGYSGYQLLMLNDFTGQSEALVGILDPFWESKGVVTAAEVREWNAPTVVLARFPKFVWSATETFQAEVEVAHFGAGDIERGRLEWRLVRQGGGVVAQGARQDLRVPAGALTPLGGISAPLAVVREPEALTLEVRLGEVRNRWKIWVYPEEPEAAEPKGVLVARAFDEQVREALRAGGRVLLLASGLKNPRASRTGFESVYWSAGWWGNRFSSLGLVCDPRHPALALFPNDGVSDWQWRDLCAGATTFDLTGAPAGFRPIVQPVPDFHYHTPLAQVFEARVGGGSLLVCGYDLSSQLARRPAARQFRRSLLAYVQGKQFRPARELPLEWLEGLLQPAGLAKRGATVVAADSEDTANGNVAANVIDGDPATFWHTRWQGRTDPLPHELVIDLGRTVTLKGIACLPRQDQANGRPAEVELYAGVSRGDWGKAKAVARWPNTEKLQTLTFAKPEAVRYLRLMVKAEVNGSPFAALAEVELVE